MWLKKSRYVAGCIFPSHNLTLAILQLLTSFNWEFRPVTIKRKEVLFLSKLNGTDFCLLCWSTRKDFFLYEWLCKDQALKTSVLAQSCSNFRVKNEHSRALIGQKTSELPYCSNLAADLNLLTKLRDSLFQLSNTSWFWSEFLEVHKIGTQGLEAYTLCCPLW